jgi:hypothetical protein
MSEPKKTKRHRKLTLGLGARIPVNVGHFGELLNQRAQKLADGEWLARESITELRHQASVGHKSDGCETKKKKKKEQVRKYINSILKLTA